MIRKEPQARGIKIPAEFFDKARNPGTAVLLLAGPPTMKRDEDRAQPCLSQSGVIDSSQHGEDIGSQLMSRVSEHL